MEIHLSILDFASRRTQYSRDDALLRNAKISLRHLSDHMKRDIGIADGKASRSASGFFLRKTKQVMGW